MGVVHDFENGGLLPFRLIRRLVRWWTSNNADTGLPEHTAQQIALQSRPIEEAIEWLQKLGETVILSFIDPNLVDTKSLDALFDPDGDYKMLFSGVEFNRERNLSEEVTRAIQSRHQDINTWQAVTVFEIERRLGLHIHGYNIPKDIWQLLSIRAWESSTFVEPIARKIEASLNSRMFYTQGQMPLMRFHHNTIWLLLAGYPLESSKRNYIDPHVKYFREIAHDFALQSISWADYCDQWILLEAYQQWETSNNWTDRAKQQIQRFPMNNQTNMRLSHMLVPNDWNMDIPEWFTIFKALDKILPKTIEAQEQQHV